MDASRRYYIKLVAPWLKVMGIVGQTGAKRSPQTKAPELRSRTLWLSGLLVIVNPCARDCFGDRKGTPKNFCDNDFAELSGELSGAICLKTLVLLGSTIELFRKFFGTVRAIFWLWGSSLALDC